MSQEFGVKRFLPATLYQGCYVSENREKCGHAYRADCDACAVAYVSEQCQVLQGAGRKDVSLLSKLNVRHPNINMRRLNVEYCHLTLF
jgi:hypothetical protein